MCVKKGEQYQHTCLVQQRQLIFGIMCKIQLMVSVYTCIYSANGIYCWFLIWLNGEIQIYKFKHNFNTITFLLKEEKKTLQRACHVHVMHRKIETLHKLGQMVDQTPKVYLSLARNEAQKTKPFSYAQKLLLPHTTFEKCF